MIGSKSSFGSAVSGLGIGEQHALEYKRCPETELTCVYDPDHAKAAPIAERLGCPLVSSYEALLNNPKVSVVSVASPDHEHGDQIVAAFQAGKHVFSEKPLCNTSEELKCIHKAWSAAGGKLYIASNLVLRTAPLYIWLKKQIEQGAFGEIFAFDADYLYGRLWKIVEGWRGTGVNYSGIKGGGVHLIDLLCWLTGQRPSTATAKGNNICTRDSSVSVEDYIATTLTFESGLIARITANLGCVHRHHHAMRIFGTKATFILDDMGPRLHSSREQALSASSVRLNHLPESKTALIPPLLETIRQGKDNTSETRQLFDTVSVCFACDASLASGEEEEIQYL